MWLSSSLVEKVTDIDGLRAIHRSSLDLGKAALMFPGWYGRLGLPFNVSGKTLVI